MEQETSSVTVTAEREVRSGPAAAPDDPAGHASRGRRRAWLWLVIVLVLAAAGVGAETVLGSDPDTVAAGEEVTPRSTAVVQRRDIVTTTSLSGTLTYADARSVTANAGGVVTWLPDVGATVEPGQPLFAVDGEPVVLLPGDLPMWRDLSVSSEDGPDIAVLEQALIDLGITDESSLTVDEDFTSATAAAVADLRELVGLSEGEGMALGDVVYLPGSVRVAGANLAVGERVQAGTSVLTVTAPERIVTVDLDAGDQGLIAEGETVEVELPDGIGVQGTVTYVSPVAEARTSSGQGATTSYVIPVEITLAGGGEAFDEAPVDITVTSAIATGVLAVPVEALLALAEGGYALEVVQTTGSTTLVAVTIGEFSDGWVAVEGENITEGLEVVTP